jgi:hypothetical protein
VALPSICISLPDCSFILVIAATTSSLIIVVLLLEAGDVWDEKIQKKFEEADIIFSMVSENLMGVKYVQENEIKNAIDKYNKFKNIKIVPILLVPYHWSRKGTYNLANFSGLPYKLLPVNSFYAANYPECLSILSTIGNILIIMLINK